MSIADSYHIKRAIQRDEDWRPQRGQLTPAGGNDDAATRTHCLFCRKKRSQYACPTCQAPYCSLSCYRSPAHANCATAFAKNAVKTSLDDLSAQGHNEGGQDEDDADGRRAMLAILGRTTSLSIDSPGTGTIEAQQDDDEHDEDSVQDDSVPVELDVRIQADFLQAWKPLLQSASTGAGKEHLLYNIVAVMATHAFIVLDLGNMSLASLTNPSQAGPSSSSTVQEDVTQQAQEASRPRQLLIPVLQSIFADIVPFITASPPTRKREVNRTARSKVYEQDLYRDTSSQHHDLVLQDAEDVVLWLLSRMQPVTEHVNAKVTVLLRRMLERTVALLEGSKVLVADESDDTLAVLDATDPDDPKRQALQRRPRALGVIADIWQLFGSTTTTMAPSSTRSATHRSKITDQDRRAGRAQRKLLFYATVLALVPTERLDAVVHDVRQQIRNLEREDEIQRERDGLRGHQTATDKQPDITLSATASQHQ